MALKISGRPEIQIAASDGKLTDRFKYTGGGRTGGSGGGGGMNDLDQRVSSLERDMSAVRADVATIKARLDSELPHLARVADVEAIKVQLPHLATKHDVSSLANKIYGAVAIAVVTVLLRDVILKLIFG